MEDINMPDEVERGEVLLPPPPSPEQSGGEAGSLSRGLAWWRRGSGFWPLGSAWPTSRLGWNNGGLSVGRDASRTSDRSDLRCRHTIHVPTYTGTCTCTYVGRYASRNIRRTISPSKGREEPNIQRQHERQNPFPFGLSFFFPFCLPFFPFSGRRDYWLS